MEATIRDSSTRITRNLKPFMWTKAADRILHNIARLARRTLDLRDTQNRAIRDVTRREIVLSSSPTTGDMRTLNASSAS